MYRKRWRYAMLFLGIIIAALAVYLVYALVNPEKL
ncbi:MULTISPECIES: K(+)-transporting ATPase subunit F [Robinsoniella]|nr:MULTISPECIES: K(+)-transporting ATPase subunit F [Robinsoniella]